MVHNGIEYADGGLRRGPGILRRASVGKRARVDAETTLRNPGATSATSISPRSPVLAARRRRVVVAAGPDCRGARRIRLEFSGRVWIRARTLDDPGRSGRGVPAHVRRPRSTSAVRGRSGLQNGILSAMRYASGAWESESLPALDATACDELPFGRPDLSARQPAAQEAAHPRPHQASPARPLGHDPGAELHLRAPEPRDRRSRSFGALRHGAGSRRARSRRERLARGDLQRGLSPRLARPRGNAPAVQAVLLPGWDRTASPRGPRLDPRGRRARLLPLARVRRRVRQSGSARGMRRRRRRGRDGAARDQLAFEQVPEPGPGRRGPSDPAPERSEDRGPHRALADPARRARRAPSRLRVRAPFRRGARPGAHASQNGEDRRHGARPDPRDPEERALGALLTHARQTEWPSRAHSPKG